MGVEIERRFLVNEPRWRGMHLIRQAYLSTDPERTVRVRTVGQKGFLTIKGKKVGASCPEFEYEIPHEEARSLMSLRTGVIITKERFNIPAENGLVWEVDVYLDHLAGLVVAEIELTSEDQNIALPPWIGEEITKDHRYSNASLAEGYIPEFLR